MLDEWVGEVLADPISKLSASMADFPKVNGHIDARVFLRNTPGFQKWETGQKHYEEYETSGVGYRNEIEQYKKEIEYDGPTYAVFRLAGRIVDVGGGAGTVREFLPSSVEFISVDPFASVLETTPQAKIEAYSCLKSPINFICGFAEFLPLQSNKFDWVHMRSMLDHVQVPDLALLEARRVLKPGGRLLVGMHVEGGRSGYVSWNHKLASQSKALAGRMGVRRWRDGHVWHPTVTTLRTMLESNGFTISREYWQPHWQDQVLYVEAISSQVSGA